MSEKIKSHHLERKAIVYVRQSSAYQVQNNRESQTLQYAMQERLRHLGCREVEIVGQFVLGARRGRSKSNRSAALAIERKLVSSGQVHAARIATQHTRSAQMACVFRGCG
jgi:hypothetical protein